MNLEAEAKALLEKMSPAELAELDRHLAVELQTWIPDPRNIPQVAAYHSTADLLLFAGEAGGGKTDLLLGTAMRDHKRSVIFREQYVDLRWLEERLLELNGGRDGYNGADMVLRNKGRMVELGALGLPGAEKNWMGRPHDFIGFDEGLQLKANVIRFVMAWLRSEDKEQRCRAIIASNPPLGGEGDWAMEWFAPWLDPLYENPAKQGELRWAIIAHDGRTIWVPDSRPVEIDGELLTPLSRTFIRCKLDSNAYLRETNYRARLMALEEPLRSKLLKGDFLAGRIDHQWQVCPSDWVRAAQSRWQESPPEGATMTTLGLDVAQGGAHDTVLAPLYANWFDRLISIKGIDTKDGPAVAGQVIMHRRHNALVVIDMTGGWGNSPRDHLKTNGVDCEGVVFSTQLRERSPDGKFGYYNMRSKMYWEFRLALDPKSGENIALPQDERLFAELTTPRWELKGDKIKIESKEDLIARLGTSPDRADAVVMAWAFRRQALLRSHGTAQWTESAEPDDPLADVA